MMRPDPNRMYLMRAIGTISDTSLSPVPCLHAGLIFRKGLHAG